MKNTCKKEIKVTITPRISVDVATKLYSLMERDGKTLSAVVESLLVNSLKGK
jgi:hypothetical protein